MVKSLVYAGLIAAVLSAAGLSTAAAAPIPMSAPTAKGKVLVDAKGMTLYTFSKDTGGKSMCNGKCAVNWPPLMASKGMKAPSHYTVVTRDDGTAQWAYRGKPLYTFIRDKKPGDVTGDGVLNGAWQLAKP
jgi:predicted lipoprotein with Yx(FWY)xxD motif